MKIPAVSPTYLTPCPVTPGQAQALESFCRAIQAACQGGATISSAVATAALSALGDVVRSPGGTSISADWSALRSPATPQAGTTLLVRNALGDELLLQLDYAGQAHIGSWTLYNAGRMIQQVALFDLVQRGVGWTLRLNHEGQIAETSLGATVPGGLVWTRQPEYPQDRAGAEIPGVSGAAFTFDPAALARQVLGSVAAAAASVASSAPPVASEPEKVVLPTVIDMPPPSISAKTTLMSAAPLLTGKLVVLNGPLANQKFLLGESLQLGREADNDLILPDGKVSRHHALIQRQGEQYQITDLGSSNGTWVNGVRIAGPTLLADGDNLLIGETKLAFSVQP